MRMWPHWRASAGIVNARGTPSVAIGTYNATPIDMAGAYTVFANNGVHLKPWMLASVRNANGDIVADFAPEAKQVLDPRTAYLTQSLAGECDDLRHRVSCPRPRIYCARRRQDRDQRTTHGSPATPRTCCASSGSATTTTPNVNDSQGADAAAPIWAEFMNRAIKLPQYSDMKPIQPHRTASRSCPMDRNTWLPADAQLPGGPVLRVPRRHRPEQHLQPHGRIAADSDPEPVRRMERRIQARLRRLTANPQSADSDQEPAPKKKNLLQKIFGGGNKHRAASNACATSSVVTHYPQLREIVDAQSFSVMASVAAATAAANKLSPRPAAVTKAQRYANKSPCAA